MAKEREASDADPTLELTPGGASGPWALEIGAPHGGTSVPVERGAQLILGSGRQADVRIEDPAVSQRHARICAEPHGVVIEDLGSKNGVYVAGARIDRATLEGGSCTFVLGRTTFTLRAVREKDPACEKTLPLDGLVGASAPMRSLARDIRRVAPLRCPVLIHGESGTGKDVIAQVIHRESRRSGHLVPINVGAIAESLADAELFGHRRGAFTGAVATRSGAFEAAHQGTLFLDEIAELSASMQVKLLRVIEDQTVRPLGGSDSVRVDVRILSATWAPLHESIAAGRFREDLFHRVATLVIDVPPLRERLSDISLLSATLLARIEDQVGKKELSSGALAALAAYGWPGNVRELGAVLLRASLAAPRARIEAQHVAAALPRQRKCAPQAWTAADAGRLLFENRGNISAAARAAGVPRSTFRCWLRQTTRKKTR